MNNFAIFGINKGHLAVSDEQKVHLEVVQLAISEMKIPFPKIFGHFNFHLRFPNRSNSSR